MHIFSLYVPQSVIAWIVIGLIAGWLAGKFPAAGASVASPIFFWGWSVRFWAGGFL